MIHMWAGNVYTDNKVRSRWTSSRAETTPVRKILNSGSANGRFPIHTVVVVSYIVLQSVSVDVEQPIRLPVPEEELLVLVLVFVLVLVLVLVHPHRISVLYEMEILVLVMEASRS